MSQRVLNGFITISRHRCIKTLIFKGHRGGIPGLASGCDSHCLMSQVFVQIFKKRGSKNNKCWTADSSWVLVLQESRKLEFFSVKPFLLTGLLAPSPSCSIQHFSIPSLIHRDRSGPLLCFPASVFPLLYILRQSAYLFRTAIMSLPYTPSLYFLLPPNMEKVLFDKYELVNKWTSKWENGRWKTEANGTYSYTGASRRPVSRSMADTLWCSRLMSDEREGGTREVSAEEPLHYHHLWDHILNPTAGILKIQVGFLAIFLWGSKGMVYSCLQQLASGSSARWVLENIKGIFFFFF